MKTDPQAIQQFIIGTRNCAMQMPEAVVDIKRGGIVAEGLGHGGRRRVKP